MNLTVMAWRNVRRNNRRTALSATAIGMAAMILILLFSLLAGLTQEMGFNLRTFYSGDIRIRHSQFDEFAHLNPLHLSISESQKLAARIAELEHVESVSARITFPASVYQAGENLNAAGMGIDMVRDTMNPGLYIVKGMLPIAGQREVLLGTQMANDLNLDIGDKFTALSMTMRRATNGMTFKVVGIVQFPLGELNRSFYIPIDTSQRFLKMGENAVDLIIKTRLKTDIDNLKSTIEGILTKQEQQALAVEIWNEISTSYAFLSMARMIYFVMGLVFYILASTVIINTTMMVVFERTREIGTLASLGMESKHIVLLFLIEAAIISAIGSLLGTLVGSVITLIFQQIGIDFTQAMEGVDFEISGVVYPLLTGFNMLYAFITGVLVATLASLIPSRRAAKIKPVVAMQAL